MVTNLCVCNWGGQKAVSTKKMGRGWQGCGKAGGAFYATAPCQLDPCPAVHLCANSQPASQPHERLSWEDGYACSSLTLPYP